MLFVSDIYILLNEYSDSFGLLENIPRDAGSSAYSSSGGEG